MTRAYRFSQAPKGEHLLLMIINKDGSCFSNLTLLTLPTFSFELSLTLARLCFKRQLSFGRTQYRKGRWYASIGYDMTCKSLLSTGCLNRVLVLPFFSLFAVFSLFVWFQSRRRTNSKCYIPLRLYLHQYLLAPSSHTKFLPPT
ncbi:hypothetical protein BDV41DRAFT_155145 [Aspergillus transmontanensis]|uniref:Uncharacterized protein n=1 Tax=Aspergillus transmontanensis TaxID=1034304 RepID=A0A5N6WGY4_9EURO|nr:hypothetical protein BDV41DRAFT_155145 [Aspergillus transmontanensis]